MASSGWDVSQWDVGNWDEVGLTPNDVESATEVTSATLGQEHRLAVDNADSVTEVTSPALAQTHVLLAEGLESVSSVDATTVGQTHSLNASNAEAQSEATSPALVETMPGDPVINPTGFGAVADFRGEEKNRKAQIAREEASKDDLTRIINEAFDGKPVEVESVQPAESIEPQVPDYSIAERALVDSRAEYIAEQHRQARNAVND